MFWVISTAFVLQGVIIEALGPIKKSAIADCFICGVLPKSHCSFWSLCIEISEVVWTAKTLVVRSPKK